VLIDRFMPRFDVSERHERPVEAPPAEAFEIARRVDLSRSPIVAALFAVRMVPQFFTGAGTIRPKITLDTFMGNGFVLLGEEPDVEIVLGAIGTFWRPTGGMRPTVAEEFADFDEPGFAKGTMNLRVERFGRDASLVTTETRVQCTDETSLRRFKAYWRLVGPFSGLIRHQMLEMIAKEAGATVTV
jgi:hypothetical protein